MSEMASNFPDGDWSFLDAALEGFGEKADLVDPIKDEDGLDDAWLPEDIDPEQAGRIQIAAYFILGSDTTYDAVTKDNIDNQALKMMRTLADFINRAGYIYKEGEGGNEARRSFSDLYPDYSVRDIFFSAMYTRKKARIELSGRMEGTNLHDKIKSQVDLLTNVAKISKRAIEMEDMRRQREEGF